MEGRMLSWSNYSPCTALYIRTTLLYNPWVISHTKIQSMFRDVHLWVCIVHPNVNLYDIPHYALWYWVSVCMGAWFFAHCSVSVHCTSTLLLHNFAMLFTLHSSLLHNFALLCTIPCCIILHCCTQFPLQLQLHYAAHSLSWPNALQSLPLQKHTSGA